MAAPQLRTDRVRVMCILYPKEGMSFEDWSTYWRVKHQEVFKNLAIVKTNVLSYEQFHINVPFHAALEQQGHGAKPPFHGMAIFEAESFEKLLAVFQDQEYLTVCRPDEENFLDTSKTQPIGGNFVSIFRK